MAGIGGAAFNPQPGGGDPFSAVIGLFTGNNPVDRILGKYVFNGWNARRPAMYGGLGQAAHQVVDMFNPMSRNGALNILSSFAGPEGDASGFLNEHMPGQFEAYTMAKSPVRTSEGQPYQVRDALQAMRRYEGDRQAQNIRAQHVHDTLFGGEVHAKGAIPRRPDTVYTQPPRNTEDTIQQIADKLGVDRTRVEAQMKAADQHTAHLAREHAFNRLLFAHGIADHTPQGDPSFVEHVRQLANSDRMPEMARVYRGRQVSVGKTGIHEGVHNLLAGGTRAEREAALTHILARQMLRHRN